MTKKFREYLHRVHVQFVCKDMDDRRTDDRKVYMFARLQTISDDLAEGATCIQCAEKLNAAYLRDIANVDTWWRA